MLRFASSAWPSLPSDPASKVRVASMDLIATVATGGALFVGTNLDDIVVLAMLSASSRADGRPKAWQIWVGQYAGLAVLVGIALLAARGLQLLPDNRVWLLGLVPTGLGANKLVAAVRADRSGTQSSIAVVEGLTGVTAITIANGGDNLAVYTPVFRANGSAEIAVIVGVFAAGIALWCAIGAWLVSHRKMTEVIERWGHWIIPAVFVGIGLYIILRS